MSGCTAFGFLVAKGFLTRVRQLRELERLIGYMSGEVRYRREILAQAFYNVSNKCKEPFASWLGGLSDSLKQETQRMLFRKEACENISEDTFEDAYAATLDFDSIWREAAEGLYLLSAFKLEDMEYVYNLGQTIGYLDVQAQEQGLMLLQGDLNRHIQRLESEMKERIRVAMILGTVVGILLVIMFV